MYGESAGVCERERGECAIVADPPLQYTLYFSHSPADPPRGGVDIDGQGLSHNDGEDARHGEPAGPPFFISFYGERRSE